MKDTYKVNNVVEREPIEWRDIPMSIDRIDDMKQEIRWRMRESSPRGRFDRAVRDLTVLRKAAREVGRFANVGDEIDRAIDTVKAEMVTLIKEL